jgi:glycerol-3-phosphate dehydrogenase (NAD(P)+)
MIAQSSTGPSRRIAVVGMGAWGSALALHCARAGHTVVGWTRDEAIIENAKKSRSFSFAGTMMPLPPNITLTSDIKAIGNADLTIVALPARAWGEVVPHITARAIISATKGLEKDSGLTPLSYAAEKLGVPRDKLAVISGPSFASDLVAGRPISIVVGCASESLAAEVATTLSNQTVRVYTSTDPIGVELGGILKNVIAIAAGVSDALGYGPSARAALITRGLAEMATLATAMGAQFKTLAGLSGLGDLLMTATEDQSRNRAVGLQLGKGASLPEVIAALGSTAEGVSSAPLVQKLAQAHGIETPITDHVVKLIRQEIAPREMARSLMTRPLRPEF